MSDGEEIVAIILGALYRDRMTGFTGRAVQITTYLAGCDSVGLQPEAKDGSTLPDMEYFDELQLERVGETIVRARQVDVTGGYRPAPLHDQPRNTEGIAFLGIKLDSIDVSEWHPLLHGQGKPTQVHVSMMMDGLDVPLVMRFKGLGRWTLSYPHWLFTASTYGPTGTTPTRRGCFDEPS